MCIRFTENRILFGKDARIHALLESTFPDSAVFDKAVDDGLAKIREIAKQEQASSTTRNGAQ